MLRDLNCGKRSALSNVSKIIKVTVDLTIIPAGPVFCVCACSCCCRLSAETMMCFCFRWVLPGR
jgi:hypothetical protein